MDLIAPFFNLQQAIERSLKQFRFTNPQPLLSGLTFRRYGMTRFNYQYAAGDAKGNAVILACLLWLARTFPEAPIEVMRNQNQGQWRVQYGHNLSRLINRPNSYYSGNLLLMATVIDFISNGNAYWMKVRAPNSNVVELWWVPQTMMEPKWPNDGTQYISHYEYDWGQGKENIAPSEVVHFRYGLDPENDRKGLSPLGALFREIFTDNEAANYTASIVRNLGVPGVVIIPGEDTEVDEDSAEVIKNDFRSRVTNDSRGEPIVMSANVKVEKLSFSPEEMTLKDLRRIPEERVSAIFGTPAVVVGLGAGLDRSTFTNFGEAREAAYEGTVIPIQRTMASDMDIQLLPDFVPEGRIARYRVGFDLSQVRILQEDKFKAYQRTNIAVNGGWLMESEAREAVGLPWDDSHKYYLRRRGVVPVPEDVKHFPDGIDPTTASSSPSADDEVPNPVNPNQPQGGRVPSGTTDQDDDAPRRNGRTREPTPA